LEDALKKVKQAPLEENLKPAATGSDDLNPQPVL
jgi:hypothetical protein